MHSANRTAEYVSLLTGHQHRLYAYITAMVPNLDTARDILQETNAVLWEKAGEFEPGSNFGAWAAKVAHFQTLAYLKRRKLDRHVFDADLLAEVADHAAVMMDSIDARQAALRKCMAGLADGDRDMVTGRYAKGGSVAAVARAMKTSTGVVSQRLYRIRKQLARCISSRLAENGGEA